MKNNEQSKQLITPDVRRSAMVWWNTLSSAERTRMCDTHTELVGSIRRWETLTGREIQMVYESEHCVIHDVSDSSFNDEKFIEALFAEYEKSYVKTKLGQHYPQWLNDEQLKWVLTVAKNFH